MTEARPSNVKFSYRREELAFNGTSGGVLASLSDRFAIVASGRYTFRPTFTEIASFPEVSVRDLATLPFSLEIAISLSTNVSSSTPSLAVTGDWLYVSDGGTALYTYDISDPTSITLEDTLAVSDGGGDSAIWIFGNTLWRWAKSAQTLQEIDITTRDAPSVTSTTSVGTDDFHRAKISPDGSFLHLFGTANEWQIETWELTSPPAAGTSYSVPLDDDTGARGAVQDFIYLDATHLLLIASYPGRYDGLYWIALEKGAAWDELTIVSHDDQGTFLPPNNVIKPNLSASAVTSGIPEAVVRKPEGVTFSLGSDAASIYLAVSSPATATDGTVFVYDKTLLPRLRTTVAATEEELSQDAYFPNSEWIDISSHVVNVPGADLDYGIDGEGPSARIANPGVLSFIVDNSEFSIAGQAGSFSPDHANVLDGLRIGAEVNLEIEYNANIWSWRGVIDSIKPSPGRFRDRRSIVTCVDFMESYGKGEAKGALLERDVTAVEAHKILLNHVTPHPVSHTETPTTDEDVFLYLFDQSPEEGTKLATELQKIVQSGRDYVFVDNGGTLIYEGRGVREARDSSTTFGDGNLSGMDPDHDNDRIINRVRTAVFPRTEDASDVTLFELQIDSPSSYMIAPGEILEITAPYTDPDEKSIRAGALSIVQPVATTDYTFTRRANGAGRDLTALLLVAVGEGANAGSVLLQNTGNRTGFLQTLKIRGTGLYSRDPLNVIGQSTLSQNRFGLSDASYSMPYSEALVDAVDAADYILHEHKDPRTIVKSITVILNNDATILDDFVQRSAMFIGDRITVTETQTGIDADYFIQSIRLNIRDRFWITATFGLKPADTVETWRIGHASLSQLGVTTIVGSGFNH